MNTLAKRSFPKFYQHYAPKLLQFYSHWLDWTEEKGNAQYIINHLSSEQDIDESIDAYSTHLKNKYLNDFPEQMLGNLKLLLKNVLFLYRAKSSRKAYDFLFRVLFDSPAKIWHPREMILKTSDGRWYIPCYISINPITDSQGNYRYKYDEENTVYYNQNEILADKNGNAIDNTWLLENCHYWRITGDTSLSVSYIENAANFSGKVRTRKSSWNTDKGEFECDIPELKDEEKSYEYGQSAISITSSKTLFYPGETLTITNPETGETLPYHPVVQWYVESQGYYTSTKGFLSDINAIQDNHYYQDYSYVIQSYVGMNRWRQIVKKLLHPAGLEFFSEVLLSGGLEDGDGIYYYKDIDWRDKTPYETYIDYLRKFLVFFHNVVDYSNHILDYCPEGKYVEDTEEYRNVHPGIEQYIFKLTYGTIEKKYIIDSSKLKVVSPSKVNITQKNKFILGNTIYTIVNKHIIDNENNSYQIINGTVTINDVNYSISNTSVISPNGTEYPINDNGAFTFNSSDVTYKKIYTIVDQYVTNGTNRIYVQNNKFVSNDVTYEIEYFSDNLPSKISTETSEGNKKYFEVYNSFPINNGEEIGYCLVDSDCTVAIHKFNTNTLVNRSDYGKCTVTITKYPSDETKNKMRCSGTSYSNSVNIQDYVYDENGNILDIDGNPMEYNEDGSFANEPATQNNNYVQRKSYRLAQTHSEITDIWKNNNLFPLWYGDISETDLTPYLNKNSVLLFRNLGTLIDPEIINWKYLGFTEDIDKEFTYNGQIIDNYKTKNIYGLTLRPQYDVVTGTISSTEYEFGEDKNFIPDNYLIFISSSKEMNTSRVGTLVVDNEYLRYGYDSTNSINVFTVKLDSISITYSIIETDGAISVTDGINSYAVENNVFHIGKKEFVIEENYVRNKLKTFKIVTSGNNKTFTIEEKNVKIPYRIEENVVIDDTNGNEYQIVNGKVTVPYGYVFSIPVDSSSHVTDENNNQYIIQKMEDYRVGDTIVDYLSRKFGQEETKTTRWGSLVTDDLIYVSADSNKVFNEYSLLKIPDEYVEPVVYGNGSTYPIKNNVFHIGNVEYVLIGNEIICPLSSYKINENSSFTIGSTTYIIKGNEVKHGNNSYPINDNKFVINDRKYFILNNVVYRMSLPYAIGNNNSVIISDITYTVNFNSNIITGNGKTYDIGNNIVTIGKNNYVLDRHNRTITRIAPVYELEDNKFTIDNIEYGFKYIFNKNAYLDEKITVYNYTNDFSYKVWIERSNSYVTVKFTFFGNSIPKSYNPETYWKNLISNQQLKLKSYSVDKSATGKLILEYKFETLADNSASLFDITFPEYISNERLLQFNNGLFNPNTYSYSIKSKTTTVSISTVNKENIDYQIDLQALADLTYEDLVTISENTTAKLAELTLPDFALLETSNIQLKNAILKSMLAYIKGTDISTQTSYAELYVLSPSEAPTPRILKYPYYPDLQKIYYTNQYIIDTNKNIAYDEDDNEYVYKNDQIIDIDETVLYEINFDNKTVTDGTKTYYISEKYPEEKYPEKDIVSDTVLWQFFVEKNFELYMFTYDNVRLMPYMPHSGIVKKHSTAEISPDKKELKPIPYSLITWHSIFNKKLEYFYHNEITISNPTQNHSELLDTVLEKFDYYKFTPKIKSGSITLNKTLNDFINKFTEYTVNRLNEKEISEDIASVRNKLSDYAEYEKDENIARIFIENVGDYFSKEKILETVSKAGNKKVFIEKKFDRYNTGTMREVIKNYDIIATANYSSTLVFDDDGHKIIATSFDDYVDGASKPKTNYIDWSTKMLHRKWIGKQETDNEEPYVQKLYSVPLNSTKVAEKFISVSGILQSCPEYFKEENAFIFVDGEKVLDTDIKYDKANYRYIIDGKYFKGKKKTVEVYNFGDNYLLTMGSKKGRISIENTTWDWGPDYIPGLEVSINVVEEET